MAETDDTSLIDRAETATRRVLRRARKVLRVLTVIAVIVTGVITVFLGPAAFAPAIVMVLIFGAWIGVAALERRARRAAYPGATTDARRDDGGLEPEPEGEPRQDVTAPEPREVRKARLKTVLALFGILVAISAVLAATLMDWRMVGLGALVIFAWLAFTGGGFWLAAVKEQVDEKRGETADAIS